MIFSSKSTFLQVIIVPLLYCIVQSCILLDYNTLISCICEYMIHNNYYDTAIVPYGCVPGGRQRVSGPGYDQTTQPSHTQEVRESGLWCIPIERTAKNNEAENAGVLRCLGQDCKPVTTRCQDYNNC